jgi:hypothetical protein
MRIGKGLAAHVANQDKSQCLCVVGDKQSIPQPANHCNAMSGKRKHASIELSPKECDPTSVLNEMWTEDGMG